MSLIPPPNEVAPPRVKFEDLRKGDFIRARHTDNRSLLQFVITELDNTNVGGSFGDWEFLLPSDSVWEFFLLKPVPRISAEYTFGWLTLQHENWGPDTLLGHWRTNSVGDGDFIEGVTFTNTADEVVLEHRKYPLHLATEFTEAKAVPLSANINYSVTTTYQNTKPCGCSSAGPCKECGL
jgi:hypothetical protein